MSQKLGARKRRLLQAQVDEIKRKFVSPPQSFGNLTAEEIRAWRESLLTTTGVSYLYVGLDHSPSER